MRNTRPLPRWIAVGLALAVLLNTAAAQVEGLTVNVTEPSAPQPGEPITVEASIDGGSPNTVSLGYVINYGEEEILVEMTQSEEGGSYFASIPGEEATAGSMIRWFVTATDSRGRSTRSPPFENSADRQYYGAIIPDPRFFSSLPVVELYCKDVRAPYNTNRNASSRCSVQLNGGFYDNVEVYRKGMSSMNWPKPKFKINAGDQGKVFKIKGDVKRVKQINMNSEWAEPGENTFMRETLTWETFRQMGVDSLPHYQTVVRLNGQYFGKYSLGVDWTKAMLESNGHAVEPTSPLFEAESGELSNLRWDLPPDQVQYYFSVKNEELGAAGDQALVAFSKGLAGGGPGSRSDYVFDWVNLPKTINLLAAQTLVLNQDRCTKNFLVYLDPAAQQWSMLAWDVESAFGIDRGLGGAPAIDYCTLACEQWNSPLACDKNHPQDLAVRTPWGLITTQINPEALYKGRRRLLQGGSAATAGTPLNGAAAEGLSLPQNSSIDVAQYNIDLTTQGPTPTGAPGSFNYLIDAIMAMPRTRAMYVRRLRSLMDQFIGSGRLQGIVSEEHQRVREEAKRDAAKWGNTGDPDRGYQQLISEQLPIRKEQLFGTHSSSGSIPLIPDSQLEATSLLVGEVASGGNGFVQIVNENDFSVDVSGWSISGGGASFNFAPGSVIPAQDSVYVAATSVSEFKKRGSSPQGGEGLFVVGPLTGTFSGAAEDVVISSSS